MGILNFKEVRNNIASPLILMMAGVIGVAGALANSGFTAMVGDAVAGALGTSVSPFVIVLVFTLLTSLACVTAAWINWIMPIDGMPAMILGMGKYKLVDFWKFTLPLYVIQILVLCGACVIVFPM